MAKLGKILRTEAMGDMSALAQLLQSMGRGKDTILAHITEEEADFLKQRGGRGSRNPDTGLLEFEDAPLPEVTVEASRGSEPIDFTSFYAPTSRRSEQISDQPIQREYIPTAQPAAAAAPAAAPDSDYLTKAPSAFDPTDAAAKSAELEKLTKEEPSRLRRTLDKLGLKTGDLVGLGLLGGTGLVGQVQAARAARQGQAYADQQKAMALPYQKAGQEMIAQAARGELTPASMQQFEAARAQAAQQGATQGALSGQQLAVRMEELRQRLLQQQYDYGLKVANIGDNIAAGAIRTAMQAEGDLNNATTNFYTNLAQFGANVLRGKGG